jgi:F0F1-type ATP synthase delta subunit
VAHKVAVASAEPAATMKLPMLVFGVVEVRRLKRELESLEEYMNQARLREPGKQASLPRVSRLLDALAAENHLNLLQSEDRKQLKTFLGLIEKHAPVIHMSFATDPSSAFTAKVVTWLRNNIDPSVLLEIGLQPTIAAGAILRTNNKIFDLSLRDRFAVSEKLLIESLEAEAALVAPATASVEPAAEAATTQAQAPVPGPAQTPVPGPAATAATPASATVTASAPAPAAAPAPAPAPAAPAPNPEDQQLQQLVNQMVAPVVSDAAKEAEARA